MRVNKWQDFSSDKWETFNLDRSDMNPFANKDCRRDLMGEEHGGDFVFLGEVSMLEHVREQIKERFLVTSANLILLVAWIQGTWDTFSKRRVSVVNFGCHLEFDERHVRSVLDRSGMGQAKSAWRHVEARRRWRQQKHAWTKFFDTYSKRDYRSMAGLCQDME